jgi:menaquinone-dependent protoporphyrinogen oxidase
MNLLIVYGSSGGHTTRIVDRLVDVALSREHQVQVMDCDKLPSDFSTRFFDAVIVGAPVYFGKHHRGVAQFVRTRGDELAGRPCAFFSVSLAAAAARPEDRAEAVDYVRDFVRETAWRPGLTAVFAGALRYSQYGLVTRAVMKRISKRAGGDTDTSQDYDYTDWEAVRLFGEGFLAWARHELTPRAASSSASCPLTRPRHGAMLSANAVRQRQPGGPSGQLQPTTVRSTPRAVNCGASG